MLLAFFTGEISLSVKTCLATASVSMSELESVATLLKLLQHSTVDDERKKATSELYRLQDLAPSVFGPVVTTLAIGSLSAHQPAEAFFAASALLEFVERCWRAWQDGGVVQPGSAKYSMIQQILGTLSSAEANGVPWNVARKLAQALAMMLKLSVPKKLGKGEVPEPLLSVLGALFSIVQSSATFCEPQCHVALLSIHLVMKELQSKRVGKLLDSVTLHMAPTVLAWLKAAVNARVAAAQAQQQEQQAVGLFLELTLKIALRVFGDGVFLSEAHYFILSSAYSLSQVGATRGVEYCVKIVAESIRVHQGRLGELGTAFFFGHEMSLFRIFELVVCQGGSTEKVCCRLLNVLHALFTAEDSSPFIAQTLAQCFADRQTAQTILRTIVARFFPDETPSSGGSWDSDPEASVADMDLVDDDAVPTSCAEQFFLAMTSSTFCRETCVAAAWEVIRELLNQPDDRRITAALHAMGIGYSTLAEDDKSVYLNFLTTNLLPTIRGEVPNVSIMVTRRVIWVVGMWCESVEDPQCRRQVHEALALVLQRHPHPVILLTALRAFEHFVSDNHFTSAELPEGMTSIVVGTVQAVMPVLQNVHMIQEVAALCSVLVEKGAVVNGGETMLQVLEPTIQRYMAKIKGAAAGGAADDALGDADSAMINTFGIVLDTAASAVKICSSASAIWSVLPVVEACTDAAHAYAAWMEDHAWDLLYTMTLHTPLGEPLVVGQQLQGLSWCVSNMTRDFESLNTCVRSTAALVHLLHGHLNPEHVALVSSRCCDVYGTCAPAVAPAYAQLADALLIFYGGAAATGVAERLLVTILQPFSQAVAEAIQDDERSIYYAFTLARCVSCFPQLPQHLAQHFPADFIERLSLCIDVCPSPYMSRLVQKSICHVGLTWGLGNASPSDQMLVQAAATALQEPMDGLDGDATTVVDLYAEAFGNDSGVRATRGCAYLSGLQLLAPVTSCAQ